MQSMIYGTFERPYFPPRHHPQLVLVLLMPENLQNPRTPVLLLRRRSAMFMITRAPSKTPVPEVSTMTVLYYRANKASSPFPRRA